MEWSLHYRHMYLHIKDYIHTDTHHTHTMHAITAHSRQWNRFHYITHMKAQGVPETSPSLYAITITLFQSSDATLAELVSHDSIHTNILQVHIYTYNQTEIYSIMYTHRALSKQRFCPNFQLL